MALKISTYLRQRIHAIILGVVVLVIVGPTLYYRQPVLVFMPDSLYVKAKIMWVLRGDIFTDPITGLVTMHPPFYHLLLAPFVAVGIDINSVMSVTSAFVVALMFLFTYKIIGRQFDRITAFWTCMLLAFIYQFMGPRNILLSSSYNFSVPFYLAGLWLYLDSAASTRKAIGAGILWGLAFLISPVYLFLIGLTFCYEAIIKGRFRRLLKIVSTFAVSIIPFYIQLYTVYSAGMGGAETFELWRGVPGLSWWQNVGVELLSPSYHRLSSFPALGVMFILSIAVVILIRKRKIHWYILLSFLAFLFTFYNFSAQYAIRIELFFSIFLVAWIIFSVKKSPVGAYAAYAAILVLAGYAVYYHCYIILGRYDYEVPNYRLREEIGEKLWKSIGSYIPKDSYIFCNNEIYLNYIMPYYPVHALGGYKTMGYFQLPDRIANRFQVDDERAENSDNIAVIDSVARKYDITTAIISNRDIGVPLYETLTKYWRMVYQDGYFGILKKPEPDSADVKQSTDNGPG